MDMKAKKIEDSAAYAIPLDLTKNMIASIGLQGKPPFESEKYIKADLQTVVTSETGYQIWSPEDIFGYVRLKSELTMKAREEEKEEEQERQNVEESALFCIADKYSKYEKVKSIYVQKYRAEIQVHVLLGITEYDDDLMEDLLDTEYDIHKEFNYLSFTFLYPPVAFVDRKDIVHPEARCIFSR
ncbi:MAG: hypothetical protein JRI26_10155 [Deltaproteobacteria bacterium]|nr:hypothetical protein [Deltaproteobacteria bacterium]